VLLLVGVTVPANGLQEYEKGAAPVADTVAAAPTQIDVGDAVATTVGKS
jgi:hypothetical protein